MTTINLHQSQEKEQSGFSNQRNGGFIFSVGIIVVTILIMAGLKLYIPSLVAKNDALAADIVTEKSKLVGLKSLENVIDIQNRLKEISSNLQITNGEVKRLEMTKMLDNLSFEMNKNIVVSSLKYDGTKVTVSLESNNFSDIAKQVFNFKTSDKFSDVGVVKLDRNEKNITCDVAMNIKSINKK